MLKHKNTKTNLFDTKIFDQLNIDLGSIISESQQNAFVVGYLKTLSQLDTDLKAILSDPKRNRKTQQQELEKLSQKNQTFNIELNYNFPKNLSKLIEKLDFYLFNEENLKSKEITAYLSSTLAENLGEHSDIKKVYKTKEMTRTIILLKFILQVFKSAEQSFGLFLIYNLSIFFRSEFNDIKLKRQIKDNQFKDRKMFFDFEYEIEEEKGIENIVINLKRIDLTVKFGEKLYKTFIHLKNACIYNLQQSVLKLEYSNFIELTEEEKFNRTYQLLNKNEQEWLKSLYNFNMEVESVDRARLGMHCIVILESANVLIDHGLKWFKKKSYSVIKISKIYANDIFLIPIRPKNLPMVIRPQFWEKKNQTKDGNLNYGGYLFNKKFNYPAIKNQHKKGITVITDSDLENINFIQSNFYTVNKQFLNYVESNFKTVVLYYLRKIPNIEFFFRNIDVEDVIYLKTLTDLFLWDTELSNLITKRNEQGSSKSLSRKIAKRRKHLAEWYKNVANLFFGLVYSFIIAFHYKDYTFYFNVFIDFCGRLYYISSGAAFGLQTSDFSRSLIDLRGNDYYFPNRIKNKSKYKSSNKAYESYVKSLTFSKEPFQFLRINKQILASTILNYASCSGTSILSALIGNKQGLLLTNVIDETSTLVSKKQCVYTFFLNRMSDMFPSQANYLFPPNQLADKMEELNMSEDEFFLSVEEFLSIIKPKLLLCDHVKQFVMRKNYAETNRGRYKYTLPEILKEAILHLYNFNLEGRKKQLYISCSYWLAMWIETLYNEVFGDIAECCQFLTEHFIEKNPITLTCPENSNYQYQQLLYEVVKILRPTFKQSRKSKLKVLLPTNRVDIQKIERSLVANFIHYLDSRLNLLVIDKCKTNRIPVWTNHDCFYVCPTKKDLLLKYYYISFIDLLLKNDVIEHFLKMNEINPSKEFREALDKYKSNRDAILYEIETTNNLKMSSFILSS